MFGLKIVFVTLKKSPTLKRVKDIFLVVFFHAGISLSYAKVAHRWTNPKTPIFHYKTQMLAMWICVLIESYFLPIQR